MSEYLQKLKDPRWQKKRLEIFERDEFTCQWCYDSQSTLHVHHIKYTTGNPWEEENENLITLCEDCHNKEELRNNNFKLILDRMKKYSPDILCDLDTLINAIESNGRFTFEVNMTIIIDYITHNMPTIEKWYFDFIKNEVSK
jgi:hypothetical protein